MPFGGAQSPYTIDGQPPADGRQLRVSLAGEDYLRVLRVPIRRGRMLTNREVDAGDAVAVINEAAAKLWSAGMDPIGRQLKLDLIERPGSPAVLVKAGATPFVTVVGIIADVRNDGLQRDAQPTVVVPYTLIAPPQRTLAVRASGPVAPLFNALRTEVRAMDPLQPLASPVTLEEIVASETAQPRFTMTLFTAFAGVGLTLAVAGLYSVLSYLVSLRTREIGIRMALGARPAHILQLVTRAGATLVAAGVVLGIAGSLLLGHVLASQFDVFGTSARDPMVFAAVVLVLGVPALGACILPARRAAAVPPTEAMR